MVEHIRHRPANQHVTEPRPEPFAIRVTYENYPDLHSDQLVAGLMDELAGTENRIAVERMWYNDAVRSYNTAVISFPNSLLAGSFGFQPRQYYDPIPGGP